MNLHDYVKAALEKRAAEGEEILSRKSAKITAKSDSRKILEQYSKIDFVNNFDDFKSKIPEMQSPPSSLDMDSEDVETKDPLMVGTDLSTKWDALLEKSHITDVITLDSSWRQGRPLKPRAKERLVEILSRDISITPELLTDICYVILVHDCFTIDFVYSAFEHAVLKLVRKSSK